MKILLEIKDSKASFIMELLNSFSFVKVKKLTNEKAELISDIREAVEEVKQIKDGTLQGIPAKELLDEL